MSVGYQGCSRRSFRSFSQPANDSCWPKATVGTPDTATVEDLRRYQLHLVDHGISPISLNAAISGLKFFFDITLDCGELIAKMQPVRVPQKLPVVLSREELGRLLAAAGSLKHQTALSVAYGAGLRVSEVLPLAATE